MTPEQEHELVLLRRAYGIGWYEAEHVLPAWEVEVLLNGLQDEPTDEGV